VTCNNTGVAIFARRSFQTQRKVWKSCLKKPGTRETNISIDSVSFTQGAEPFLRSRQFCSYSRISQHFMDSLPCSREPSTRPDPEPDQSNPYHPILFFKIYSNIIHPSMSWSSKSTLSFWLSHQYPIRIPLLPNSFYIPYSSHPRLILSRLSNGVDYISEVRKHRMRWVNDLERRGF
jgi:hypothetical protein